jgi:aspartate carbamoyltransferase catalytic subunit
MLPVHLNLAQMEPSTRTATSFIEYSAKIMVCDSVMVVNAAEDSKLSGTLQLALISMIGPNQDTVSR